MKEDFFCLSAFIFVSKIIFIVKCTLCSDYGFVVPSSCYINVKNTHQKNFNTEWNVEIEKSRMNVCCWNVWFFQFKILSFCLGGISEQKIRVFSEFPRISAKFISSKYVEKFFLNPFFFISHSQILSRYSPIFNGV